MPSKTEKNIYAGLSTKEAANRLIESGQNRIESHETTALRIFIKQFSSPLILLLIAAAGISFYIGDATDGVIVTCILFLNSVLGFIQEYRSHQTYEKLKTFVSSKVTVLRDGEQKIIDKVMLVPGDLALFKLGDIVSADCFILESKELLIDESSITGESIPIAKRSSNSEDESVNENILYSGSYIQAGTATVKVFATGVKSKFGEIANLSINTKKITEYEENLKRLTEGFLIISISTLILIFGAHIVLQKTESFVSILLFTVAIAITIIPEALPIVATLTLAKNAVKLSKHGVIIKRSSAIEDLGNLDIICTDKTGTLTENKLVVHDYIASNKIEFYKLSHLSCSQSSDPFDSSITEYLDHKKYTKPKLAEFTEDPFNPELKFSAREFETFSLVKGAPEYIISICPDIDKDLELTKIQAQSDQGFRAISLAYQEKKTTRYLGTYFLVDQIKEDVDATIKLAQKHGVQFKVITGDSLTVAVYVGKKVGLIEDITEAVEVSNLNFHDPIKLAEQVENFTIFSRADPVQKFKIIQALQKNHHIGYLGDGINDAPSLKLSNVGMVVDTASDIAKSTADIILLTKSLKVIIEGVIEGRKAFENINKYVKHTLIGNFGDFFTIGVFSVFLSYLPILPIQILISNLLTDIPSLAFASDYVEKSETKKPKHRSTSELIKFSVVLAVVASLSDVVFFMWARKFEVAEIQTMWFAFSTLSNLLIIFSIRTKSLIFKGSKPGKLLLWLTLSAIFATLIAIYIGIPGLRIERLKVLDIAVITGLSITYLFVTEIVKLLFYKLHKQREY